MGEDLPSVAVSAAELEKGIPAFLLFTQSGLTQSNGEARRLIKGGGARLNDLRIEDENRQLRPEDLGAEGIAKLSAGRKKHGADAGPADRRRTGILPAGLGNDQRYPAPTARLDSRAERRAEDARAHRSRASGPFDLAGQIRARGPLRPGFHRPIAPARP